TLARIALGPEDDHAKRVAIVDKLDVGDLVYIPGHVMLVIGHDDGLTWVIHDVAGASYRDAAGQVQRVRLNGVSVTPLEPLRLGDGTPFIDRITRIQRLRAPTTE
ncbi:MAG: NlpC-P60 family protein, partial [Xanthomonas sp.]